MEPLHVTLKMWQCVTQAMLKLVPYNLQLN